MRPEFDVVVVGPGALGRVFAARLASRMRVALVARSDERARELERGFLLAGPGGREGRVFLPAFGPEAVPPVHWAIVLVKGPDTEAAARVAGRAAREGVVSLQNGWVRERLRRVVGEEVWADQGATTAAAKREGARTIWVSPGRTWLPERARSLAEALSAVGLPAEAGAEVAQRRLEKLAINLVINPLTAVLDRPNGALLEPELWGVVRELVAEMHPVLAARGLELDEDALLARLREVLVHTASNTSSMLADVRAGRPTEIEEITGVLLGWGRELDRPLPRHAALYRLVRAVEQVDRGEAFEE
ncbi:ketopantoate reductase family protein [Oceanithermus sp.]